METAKRRYISSIAEKAKYQYQKLKIDIIKKILRNGFAKIGENRLEKLGVYFMSSCTEKTSPDNLVNEKQDVDLMFQQFVFDKKVYANYFKAFLKTAYKAGYHIEINRRAFSPYIKLSISI